VVVGLDLWAVAYLVARRHKMRGCYCKTCEGQRAYDRARNQLRQRIQQKDKYEASAKGLVRRIRSELRVLLRRLGR
jgi:hypothetical protein